MKIQLLPHTPFLKNGKFELEEAILYSAKLAGECYEPDGYNKLKDEDVEKTKKRANRTLAMEHATPYEHVHIGMEITGIPKILAMILNNERQCTTSEKSARYTKITTENVSENEANLYNKWFDIFKDKISSKYSNDFNDSKIEKLAQENARYFISIFVSTKMIHTLPLMQLNRIVSFMLKFKESCDDNEFNVKLCKIFDEFIDCLKELNLVEERALSNHKNRTISLFSEHLVENYFGYTYSTNYKGSLAQIAHAHRHRTLEYSIKFLDKNEYFIPPIIKDDKKLFDMWNNDMDTIFYPQGLLVSINESGTMDKFILKMKERLCTAAQVEIADQTKMTLTRYYNSLKEKNHELESNLKPYTKGARCTFKDYECTFDCKFKPGKLLTRDI